MNKKSSEQIKKQIINDIEKTIAELYRNNLVRDRQGVDIKQTGRNAFELTFSSKCADNNIMYDKHISASYIMNKLLNAHQYIVLLYDKSIVQAEFVIDDGEVIKERLVFIKKHNRIWDMGKILQADAEDEDWFSDEKGIPVFLRIDYDVSSHVECAHPVSHLTLSNNESCRIPIQDAITFSEFIRFVLFHFYSIKLDIAVYRFDKEFTITDLERKMIHIGWS